MLTADFVKQSLIIACIEDKRSIRIIEANEN